MNLVTINETSFFRFSGQFDALRESVVPGDPGREVQDEPHVSRVVGGVLDGGGALHDRDVASGLAACVPGLTPEVLGTDVSTQALDRARAAVYRAKSLAGLPQHIVQRWFEPVAGGHRPGAGRPRRGGLLVSQPDQGAVPAVALMGNWDVIFCRNVTIYFKFESTRRVVNNLFESLNPGGYLFIGHSETLTSISDRFEVVEIDGVFLYRKPRPRRYVTFDEVLASRQRAKTTPPSAPRLPRRRGPRAAPQRPLPAAGRGAARATTSASDPRAEVAAHVERAYQLLELGMPSAGARRLPTSRSRSIRRASTRSSCARTRTPTTGTSTRRSQEARTRAGDRPAHGLGALHPRHHLPATGADQTRRSRPSSSTIYSDRDFVLAHFSLANLYKSRRSDSTMRAASTATR